MPTTIVVLIVKQHKETLVRRWLLNILCRVKAEITHLHETFRYPLTDFLIPFTNIEQEFGCRHLPLELPFSESTLLQWDRDKTISINNESIPFDYLLIASGALNNNADQDSGDVMGLNAFMKHPGSEILSQFLSKPGTEAPISVIGGGATGIQFLLF